MNILLYDIGPFKNQEGSELDSSILLYYCLPKLLPYKCGPASNKVGVMIAMSDCKTIYVPQSYYLTRMTILHGCTNSSKYCRSCRCTELR
jgi:hypothetical protein